MEKLSRVKKYEQLREEIMNDAESQLSSSDLSEFAERLNRIDADHFEKMEVKKEQYDPVHLRRESYFDTPVIKEEERITDQTSTESFSNEYLDEYINEVKLYNQRKGYSSEVDTMANIFSEIKKEKTKKKSELKFIEGIDVIQTVPSFEDTTHIPNFAYSEEASEISQEVRNLVSTEDLSSDPFDLRLQDLAVKEAEGEGKDVYVELEKEKQMREKLMSETVQIRAQLSDYDKELNDVNNSVLHANKVLNVVLIILIFAMLIIIGVIGYWILLDKGII